LSSRRNIVNIFAHMDLRYLTRVLYLCVFFLAIALQTLQAQSVVTKSLNFGNVTTGDEESISLRMHLGKSKLLKVSVRVFGDGFSVKKTTHTLQRGVDSSITIYFSPEQNLAYNGEVFIGVDGIWNLRADLTGKGRLSNSYYASTYNLWDKDLMEELESITSKGQTSLGYNSARDEMYGDLDNYSGKVTCAYTGRVATFNSRSGANNNSFNCEHTWPQSKFCSSESSFMKADIHHLFATDVNSNSRRGSYPFGKVTGSVTWQEGGSKLGGGIFEPRDEQKGATARSVLYMVMRYGDCSSFLGSQESTLRSWANSTPPSTKEVNRNKGIYSLQKNRNPFVDVPEFVDRIFSFKGNQTRTLEAKAVAVDTLLWARREADSLVYYAYIVNTGTSDFEIRNVSGDFDNYSTSATTAAPGEAVRIRMAVKKMGAGNEVVVSFKQGYLSDIKLMLDFTIGVDELKTAPSVPTPLIQLVNGTVERNRAIEGDIYISVSTLNGTQLFSGKLEEQIDLNAWNNHQVLILRARNQGFHHSQAVLLR